MRVAAVTTSRWPWSASNRCPRSLSDLGVAGCESAAAVHFSPSFCPIAGLWGCKSRKNCPRWGRFSLCAPQVRQPPSPGKPASGRVCGVGEATWRPPLLCKLLLRCSMLHSPAAPEGWSQRGALLLQTMPLPHAPAPRFRDVPCHVPLRAFPRVPALRAACLTGTAPSAPTAGAVPFLRFSQGSGLRPSEPHSPALPDRTRDLP